MIEYHEERMSTVNKIMGKLWKHVYKGTDTSSIEICTEPTEVSNNRRSYNYKLIQTKHGCKMDMKGRCSAGQKVNWYLRRAIRARVISKRHCINI